MGATRITIALKKCIQTFPYPLALSSDADTLISKWNEALRNSTVEFGHGYTPIFNEFHCDGSESDAIRQLRAAKRTMDQAVAAAYGWIDFDLGHGFHATKQGIRYTLSESARRTVLDRLLALNHQRHAEELGAGLHEKKSKKPAAAKPATKRGRKTSATAPETGAPAMLADFRFPAPSPQLYAVNLITALLAARPDGLAWPVLRDAFVAVTTPDLMRRLALPEDKDRVAAWASRWNERASPGLLIPTLREMTSANIAVGGNGTSAVFSLQDGPQESATEDVGYDAWLALRVTEPLSTPFLPDDESGALDAEIEALLANL